MLIDGSGAALSREQILTGAAGVFSCMVDQSKHIKCLEQFTLPVEVIPEATNLVCR
jgi:ribose 5-phosphate isomerase A